MPTPATLKDKKILIVDDEPDLREVLDEEFRLQGAIVQTARTGAEAFELLKKEVFDIVLSDIRMPKGDGRYLLKQINDHLKIKPLFFIYTGLNDVSAEEAKEIGITEMFQKPLSVSHIITSILKYLK